MVWAQVALAVRKAATHPVVQVAQELTLVATYHLAKAFTGLYLMWAAQVVALALAAGQVLEAAVAQPV